MQLFRVLIPSWRFFDKIEYLPALVYRVKPMGETSFGPWSPLVFREGRGLANLLLDSQGNLRMACNSLVERLMSDLEDWDETRSEGFSQTVTYRLVARLVRSQIQKEPIGTAYQFKVGRVTPGLESRWIEDALISEEHQVE